MSKELARSLVKFWADQEWAPHVNRVVITWDECPGGHIATVGIQEASGMSHGYTHRIPSHRDPYQYVDQETTTPVAQFRALGLLL